MRILIYLLLIPFSIFGQTESSSPGFIQHDTILVDKPDAAISAMLLKSIETGKVKASDSFSDELIPSRKVYSWRMPVDSVWKEEKVQVVQQYRVPAAITRIKIYQDWYFNSTTGQFSAIIKRIELYEDARMSSGEWIGYRAFCKIDYPR